MLKRILLCTTHHSAPTTTKSFTHASLKKHSIDSAFLALAVVILFAMLGSAQAQINSGCSSCPVAGSGLQAPEGDTPFYVEASMAFTAGAAVTPGESYFTFDAVFGGEVSPTNPGSLGVDSPTLAWGATAQDEISQFIAEGAGAGGAGGSWGGPVVHSGEFFGGTAGFQSSTWTESGWGGGVGYTNTGSIERQSIAEVMPLVLMVSGGMIGPKLPGAGAFGKNDLVMGLDPEGPIRQLKLFQLEVGGGGGNRIVQIWNGFRDGDVGVFINRAIGRIAMGGPGTIRFNLDGIEGLTGADGAYGEHAPIWNLHEQELRYGTATTAWELSLIKSFWRAGRLGYNNVTFYLKGEIVGAPW